MSSLGVETPARNTRPRNRKDLIVAAAAELFYEYGYPHASMEDIAQAVAVGPSALYRHFRGKQDLLQAVLLARTTTFRARVDEARASNEPLTLLGLAAMEHRDFGVLWERESRHLDDTARRALGVSVRSILDELTAIVRARRDDLDAADSEAVAWLTIGVLLSPSFHHVTLPDDGLVTLIAAMSASVTDQDWSSVNDSVRRPGRAPLMSRREQLLNEAIVLFAEQGYQAVSIEDIAAAAGLTGTSIYRHFTTKNQILVSAITRGAEWLRLDLNRALARTGAPEQTLRALVASYLGLVLEHPDLISVMLTETGHLPDQDQRRIRQEQRDYIAEWVNLLVAIHPDEHEDIARCRAQAAFTMANTCTRNAQMRKRPDLGTRLEDACLAVLLQTRF